MARTKALNITLAGGSTKTQLAEIYGAVIENINVTAVSSNLKNANLSGNPNAGSVEVKRFANSAAKAYGTARAAGKGDALVEKPITVNLDQRKEIVEEFENFDIAMYGVPALLAKRAADHVETLARTLDTEFFATAVAAGTAFTPTKTKKVQILEEVVAAIESTKNDYVDGVDRADIAVTVTSAWASELRNELDELPNGMTYTNGLVGQLHGFDVYVSNRLPAGVDAVAMRYDSVAQPCIVNQYKEEKVPLSNATAAMLFFDYGTKAVTEDLIQYISTADSTGGDTEGDAGDTEGAEG